MNEIAISYLRKMIQRPVIEVYWNGPKYFFDNYETLESLVQEHIQQAYKEEFPSKLKNLINLQLIRYLDPHCVNNEVNNAIESSPLVWIDDGGSTRVSDDITIPNGHCLIGSIVNNSDNFSVIAFYPDGFFFILDKEVVYFNIKNEEILFSHIVNKDAENE